MCIIMQQWKGELIKSRNLTYSCIIYSSEFCLGSLQYKEGSQIGCV